MVFLFFHILLSFSVQVLDYLPKKSAHKHLNGFEEIFMFKNKIINFINSENIHLWDVFQSDNMDNR